MLTHRCIRCVTYSQTSCLSLIRTLWTPIPKGLNDFAGTVVSYAFDVAKLRFAQLEVRVAKESGLKEVHLLQWSSVNLFPDNAFELDDEESEPPERKKDDEEVLAVHRVPLRSLYAKLGQTLEKLPKANVYLKERQLNPRTRNTKQLLMHTQRTIVDCMLYAQLSQRLRQNDHCGIFEVNRTMLARMLGFQDDRVRYEVLSPITMETLQGNRRTCPLQPDERWSLYYCGLQEFDALRGDRGIEAYAMSYLLMHAVCFLEYVVSDLIAKT